MIGDYLVVALVFGIAGSFVFSIHHFWLRDAFKKEAQQSVPAKNEGTCTGSTTKTSLERRSRGLSQTLVPGGLSEKIAGARLTKNQLTSAATPSSQRVGDEWRPPRLVL